ncbi:MAG: acyltransferase family protein [Bacilli bacterium]|nr:acyltransferase family protein [Bacilli bacterium]
MKKNYACVDIFKIIFALGIVALHTGFLLNYSFGYYAHTIFFRLGVPFFFLASGYFLGKKESDNLKIKCFNYIKTLLIPYLILSIIYLILNAFRFNDFTLGSLLNNLWFIITGRSQSIMWFIGSLIFSTLVILHLNTNKKLKIALYVSLLLYIIGLMFNTYAFLINNDTFNFIYSFLIGTFTNNSNFIFTGTFFFLVGYLLEKNITPKYIFKHKYLLLIISLIFLIVETIIVKKNLALVSNYEYFLSYIILIPILFYILLGININIKTNMIRKISSYIYYFHFIFIILLIFINNLYPNIILNNTSLFYICTIMLTILFSLLLLKYLKNVKSLKDKIIKIFVFVLYSIAFIFIIFSLLTLLNSVVWADEICSLAMIKHTFIDIIKINMNDVHPPLYYLLLKYFNEFISIFINISPIIISKLFSFFPYIIIIIIINKYFKNKYGIITSSMATFFITCMPQMIYYFFEIRMYSWVMCFITLSYYAMDKVIEYNKMKNWYLFIIFGTISSYLHLYGALAFSILYFGLLIYIIFNNKLLIKRWLTFGFIYFVLYLPWLLVIIGQLKNISNGFWISNLTIDTIISYFRFFLSFEHNTSLISNFITFLLLLFVLIIVFLNIKRKSDESKKNFIPILGILSIFILLGISIIISFLSTPIFVARYMFSILGVFWIAYSILYSNLIIRYKSFIIIFFISLSISLYNFNSLVNTEIEKENNIKEFYALINEISKKKNAVIITNDIHKEFEIAYFLPNQEIYLWQQSNNEAMNKLYGNINNNININDIMDFLDNSQKVYFVDDNNNTTISNFTNNKIKINFKKSVVADWYYMNFYEMAFNKKEKK